MGRSVGTILGGRYELRDIIGEGGNGTVFRAIQRPLGRAVAVKMLRGDAGSAEAQRFAREISLVQRLEHPNTVRLYDFGSTDDGTPFIVFELLRGRTLEAEVALGPLSPARVAKIAVQILKSLMEAHGQGIVHRDVKPANVLLVDYSGERDFVKVLDFGVARVVDGPLDKTITRHGQIVGTPAYMAPEQVRDARISPRTDLYAVGLLMAEALAGRPVFSGSDGAVWVAQASDAPVPLPAAVRGSILGAIVEKATRKDPAARYTSAEEMIDDIERATLEELVVPTVPDPPGTTPGLVLARSVEQGSALRTAKHLSMGAFVAMVLLMIALMGVQLRAATRLPAPAPAAMVVHAERTDTLGWRADKAGDSIDAQGVRGETWILRSPDDLPQAYIYLTTFRDEQQARSFAAYTRAGAPTTAVRHQGVQVLRTNANDRLTAERLMLLVL